jgi:hypothetical protein
MRKHWNSCNPANFGLRTPEQEAKFQMALLHKSGFERASLFIHNCNRCGLDQRLLWTPEIKHLAMIASVGNPSKVRGWSAGNFRDGTGR